VAANTLIGLDKPAQVSLRNREIDRLESELKEVRKNHFSARSRKEKIRLRNLDEKLRNQIASLLIADGWYDKSAKQLADWNPYNQNSSSPFFDPEWMLGIDNGFDIVIGNPPYLESRHPSFTESLKNNLQKAIKARWKDDSKFITRGSDLLIYFFETGLSLINEKGNVIFITQNSWLDTEYGKMFQKFLLKNTWVKGIFDSDYKYFDSIDGPNINTLISIFIGKHTPENEVVTFTKFHENFREMNYSVFDLNVVVDPGRANVRKYSYSHSSVGDIKWGILLAAPEEFFNLLNILKTKCKKIDSIKGHRLAYGQGLNLTSNYFIDSDSAKRLSVSRDARIPILTSDDGAPFDIASTKYVLIDRSKINSEMINSLNKQSYGIFDPNCTKKHQPILIMPRGLGRHFCAFNSANAFSSSGVDIYDIHKSTSEEIKYNLWLSLNSSICWLWREISGRKNLGGGMLKAEAVDMESLPIYMDFRSIGDIKLIFSILKQRQALDTIVEIDSSEHQRIDQMVFEYLGLSEKDRNRIVTILKSIILARSKKSRT